MECDRHGNSTTKSRNFARSAIKGSPGAVDPTSSQPGKSLRACTREVGGKELKKGKKRVRRTRDTSGNPDVCKDGVIGIIPAGGIEGANPVICKA